MEFRHSGNGAVRRRRVLLDDNSAASSNKSTPNKSKRQAGSALKYAEAARALDACVVMRLTADTPFLDPAICSQILCLFESSGADYASNVEC